MKKSNLMRMIACVITVTMIAGLAVGLSACKGDAREYTDFTVTEYNRHMVGFTGEEGEHLIIPEAFELDGVWYRVTVIDDYAFYDCFNLESLTLPESVTEIGSYAFYSCFILKSIVIPDGVSSIGVCAFDDCVSLASVVIPKSVKNVEKSAFDDCLSLKTIYFEGKANAWKRVEIDDGNDLAEQAEVYYYRSIRPIFSKAHYWHYVDGVPTAW